MNAFMIDDDSQRGRGVIVVNFAYIPAHKRPPQYQLDTVEVRLNLRSAGLVGARKIHNEFMRFN